MDLYNASNGVDLDQTAADEQVAITLDEYEDMKKALETDIARGDIARRLASNEDFKELVMVGYLEDEPKRLAELMASGRLHETTMNNCAKSLAAVGDFRNFMKQALTQGEQAREELEGLEEARNEAIAEAEAAAAE